MKSALPGEGGGTQVTSPVLMKSIGFIFIFISALLYRCYNNRLGCQCILWLDSSSEAGSLKISRTYSTIWICRVAISSAMNWSCRWIHTRGGEGVELKIPKYAEYCTQSTQIRDRTGIFHSHNNTVEYIQYMLVYIIRYRGFAFT